MLAQGSSQATLHFEVFRSAGFLPLEMHGSFLCAWGQGSNSGRGGQSAVFLIPLQDWCKALGIQICISRCSDQQTSCHGRGVREDFCTERQDQDMGTCELRLKIGEGQDGREVSGA